MPSTERESEMILHAIDQSYLTSPGKDPLEDPRDRPQRTSKALGGSGNSLQGFALCTLVLELDGVSEV